MTTKEAIQVNIQSIVTKCKKCRIPRRKRNCDNCEYYQFYALVNGMLYRSLDKSKTVLNGITFYHDEPLPESTVQYLTDFSKSAEDDCYTVYYDGGNLVIY